MQLGFKSEIGFGFGFGGVGVGRLLWSKVVGWYGNGLCFYVWLSHVGEEVRR